MGGITRLLALVAGVTLLAGVLGLPVAASEPSESPDILNYAEHFGVSLGQARLEIDHQLEAGFLDEELSKLGPDWFAGLWISHEPAWHVIVASVDVSHASLVDAVQRSDLRQFVELHGATVTLQDMLTDADRLRSAGGGRFRVDVDVPGNQLVIVSPSPADAAGYIATTEIATRAHVVFKEGERHIVAATDMYAGRSLYRTGDGAFQCTSGFSVLDGLLQGYVTTAAHCPNNLTIQGGVALTFGGDSYGGEYDHQLHYNFAHTVRNWTYDGITYPNYRRSITGKISRANQPLGATYCKYGRSTYYDCGELVDRFAECDIPNPAFHCMRLERYGVDMVSPGDSGGPVFISGNAVGMIQACLSQDPQCDVPSETNPMVYISSNFIEAGLGVTIKTSP